MKRKLMAIPVVLLAALGWLLGSSIPAAATPNSTVKYDTTFVYQGNNTWTVSPNGAQFALHNIGSHQAWLCNTNNVGPGISPCVIGQVYPTNGEANSNGFDSCVYIQGDSPAFDTVPGDSTKRVCANDSTPTPTPTPTATATVTPTPTPTVTVPSSTPTPTTPAVGIPNTPESEPVATLPATGPRDVAGAAVIALVVIFLGLVGFVWTRERKDK